MLCEVEASGVVSITKAFHKFNWKNVSESWSRQTWIVSNIWLQSRSRLTTADDNQNMISHFWDRPVPIFSDVSFSYLALVQDKKITCVLQANACCTVYVNWIDKKTTWDIDNLCWWWITSGADPGFVVGGVSRRGVWDRLRSPAGPRQSPGMGPRRAKPPGSSGGLRNYRHLFERQFWTNHTIFIRPKKKFTLSFNFVG
jgi:hypothetical protein